LKERFTPVSANITELDPECEGVSIVTAPVARAPRIAMSNSSGFGGTNVSIVLQRWEGSEPTTNPG
jgi:3-oxoacyl-[acyl-carrier-protein] synthase-1